MAFLYKISFALLVFIFVGAFSFVAVKDIKVQQIESSEEITTNTSTNN